MVKDLTDLLCDYFRTQPIVKAYLFGSYAQATFREDSDIDILVELDPEVPIGIEYVQMYLDLKELTGKEIDLVTIQSLSKYVKPQVDQEKQLIYER